MKSRSRLLVAALAAALVAAGGASARSHMVPPDGAGVPTPLKAFWRLDEPSGPTAYDATAQGHDGTYLNGPTLGVDGAPANTPDQAAAFDGTQGVQVPYSPALNPDTYTVEAWVRPSALPPTLDLGTNAKSIACSRSADGGVRGWMLYLDDYVGHPQFAFVVGAGSSRRYVYDSSGAAVQTGRWYHVAATFDGTDLQLYVDGVGDRRAAERRQRHDDRAQHRPAAADRRVRQRGRRRRLPGDDRRRRRHLRGDGR